MQQESLGVTPDLSTLERELQDARDRLAAALDDLAPCREARLDAAEPAISPDQLRSIRERLHSANVELGSCVDALHYANADVHDLLERAYSRTAEAAADASERHRVLVAELNHRVRNMLQVVLGIASQSMHRAADLPEFEAAFFGRVRALARAYDLLSHDGWHKVPMHELLRAQLSPFAAEGGRYSASGDRVVLRPNTALALGLVLYELATNATKYGALSVASGHVQVDWRLESESASLEQFVLSWQESGGPSVSLPTHHGFGSELVQRQLKYELKGRAQMEYRESGLIVTIRIPASEAIET